MLRATIALSWMLAVTALLAPSQPVDLVLLNAHVVTMNQSQPGGEAVAISGGHIAWVGASADARTKFPTARSLDLAGATVLPGIIDAHTHLLNLGESLLKLNIKDAHTPEQAAERVRNSAK
jgi:predicted amidohydrolase YtcJ